MNLLQLSNTSDFIVGNSYIIPRGWTYYLVNLAHYDAETYEFTFEYLLAHVAKPNIMDHERMLVLNIDQLGEIAKHSFGFPIKVV